VNKSKVNEMWELLKNKNNPPKIVKTEIIKKEEIIIPKNEIDDDSLIFEAIRKSKELRDKKIVTEKVNFAGGSYE
jgi:hypothetical protein